MEGSAKSDRANRLGRRWLWAGVAAVLLSLAACGRYEYGEEPLVLLEPDLSVESQEAELVPVFTDTVDGQTVRLYLSAITVRHASRTLVDTQPTSEFTGNIGLMDYRIDYEFAPSIASAVVSDFPYTIA
jgi:hypothetical protein